MSLGLDYVKILSSYGDWAVGAFVEVIFASHPECYCVHVKSETELLYRFGIGYAYHKNSFILTPTVDIDLVRSSTAFVFGINVGLQF